MNMTESEICVSYREAKDKKKQVEILAQLAATNKKTVLSILTKNGYADPFAPGVVVPSVAAVVPEPEPKISEPALPPVATQPIRTSEHGRMRWDEVNLNNLRQMLAEGRSINEIAEEFGVSYYAIQKQISSKGLRSPAKPPEIQSAPPAAPPKEAPPKEAPPKEAPPPLTQPPAVDKKPVAPSAPSADPLASDRLLILADAAKRQLFDTVGCFEKGDQAAGLIRLGRTQRVITDLYNEIWLKFKTAQEEARRGTAHA